MDCMYQEQKSVDSFTPSDYQQDIFEWVVSGGGHGVVEAVAGSGKTLTIVNAADLIKDDGLFVAFNKAIADELVGRLASTTMVARTVHSAGMAALRNRFGRVHVDTSKYVKLAQSLKNDVENDGVLLRRSLTDKEKVSIRAFGYPVRLICRLVELARMELLNPDSPTFQGDLDHLVFHHNLDVPWGSERVVSESVTAVIDRGLKDQSVIDFTDMIYMPVVLHLRPRQYPWVFIDEAQDISRAQFELLSACVSPGGRTLWVGDRRQAIYGWRGADADSFANIIKTNDAHVMPLSVCYRCPTDVLDIARPYCPQIEAAPGAPKGVVTSIPAASFESSVREGDMVLCRLNAPLVGKCLGLIASGIPATIRGRDVSKGLSRLVDDAARLGPFPGCLNTWEAKMGEYIRGKLVDEDEIAEQLERIFDKAECARLICMRCGLHPGPGQIKASIAQLFNESRQSVIFSSVHRAKGLENDRVFILWPHRLGEAPWAKRPWMVKQERNVAYVAYTRARRELIFVDEQ